MKSISQSIKQNFLEWPSNSSYTQGPLKCQSATMSGNEMCRFNDFVTRQFRHGEAATVSFRSNFDNDTGFISTIK